MLVAGCDSVWYSEAFCTGPIADGQVTVTASQVTTAPGEIGGAGGGPAWHVRMTDAAGQLLIAWDGLQMRDAGPLPHQAQPDASLVPRQVRAHASPLAAAD